MNYLCLLITRGKYDLLSHIDFILWRTEPSPLSSIWIHVMVSKRATCCMYLIAMSWFSSAVDWLSLWLSLLLPSSLIELWLDLRFTVKASLRLTAERRRERGGRGVKCRDRDSLLLTHPPSIPLHCQHRGCSLRERLNSATAEGWWWREVQLCVYKPRLSCPPGRCSCQMGFERRGLVICDSTVCGFFISTWHNSRPIHC